MRVFIAGTVQGSRADGGTDDQGYRTTIADTIKARFPDAEVVDPWAITTARYGPGEEKRAMLHAHAEAARCDLLVACVPAASMGTAVEMWEAYRAGSAIVAISPLRGNWIIQFLSDVVLADLDAFGEFVAGGGIEETVGRVHGAVALEQAEALYRAARERWGEQAQMLLVFEEFGEFQARLAQYLRGRRTLTELAEEFVDAEDMLVQVGAILKDADESFAATVERLRCRRRDRLARRLRDGNHWD
jgi:hypothetical protein